MNKIQKKYCYLNDKIISLDKAHISLSDIGMLRGYGVFDFLKTIEGKPFLYDEHIKRLKNSAKLLNLKLPINDKKLLLVINKLLSKNAFKESNIRIVLTGGELINGMGFNSSTFYVLVEKSKKLPSKLYKEGVGLITFEHKREIPKAKTLNYISAVRLYNTILKKKKAFEILYTHNGNILECSTSNFFIFKNNKLITAKENILLGTTRNLVIKLAREGFQVYEKNIKKNDLISADEAFITATNKGILPIVSIDGKKIGDGKVGSNTIKLMCAFARYVEEL